MNWEAFWICMALAGAIAAFLCVACVIVGSRYEQ